jgi:TRAP-type mannitol/chloroaromatic compound transport system permease small subunit
MPAILRLSRAIDAVNGLIGRFAEWLVLVVVLIGAATATLRYLVSYGSNAFLEAQWYLFGAIVLLGAAHTLKLNEHVRVDLFYGYLSRRGRLWVDTIGLVFFLLPAMIYLTWLSWPLVVNAWRIGETSPNYGGLVRWPIYLMLPLGFALVALQGVSELIKRIAGLAGVAAVEADYIPPTH